MLEIKPIMNSCVEEVLGFKTCCGLKMFDGNLEIHVTNRGDEPVVVRSCFDIETTNGSKRIEAVMPQGEHRIEPGDVMAFYTHMDEQEWNRIKRLVFHDTQGNEYSAYLK